MRNLIKKTSAIAMIGAAALAVSACGKTETTNTTENTSMTDMNAMAPTEGTTNDAAAADLGNSANGGEVLGDNSSNVAAENSSMMGSNSSNTM